MKVAVRLTIDGTIEIEEEPFSVGEDYGKRVKERRKARDLNLVQLSQLSGVSASHIARIERGERWPGTRIVAKLEQALRGEK